MVYPCTGRATPAAPPVPQRFSGGCGIRPVPHSRQTHRERVTLPPINGVDNASPPTSSCMPGDSPVSMTVSYSVSACGADSWPLWAGIATPQQAQEIVARQYSDTTLFCCPAGVRSLSPLEKMYNTKASGNPSSWQGPVWICVNYLVFRGLLRYGYTAEARLLAWKTIILLGRDFERFGALHEYYLPENGEPVLNRGFQNWNFLVLNMIAWLDGRPLAEEF